MKQWHRAHTQYALFDINNFYVSAERAFDPTIRDKPVAVFANNDGCIIARDTTIKAMGIQMGTPVFEVRQRLQRSGVVLRSSNYTLYHEMSARFLSVLEHYCDDLRQYSIDESFLVFTGYDQVDLSAHCQQAVAAVKQWTSMPCCAGIAPTRTLAKACNHYAKALGVAGGVLQLRNEYHRQQLLQQLPVGDVWGVGPRLTQRLALLGITTAWELSTSHIPTMRRHFGVTLERTIRELNGVSCIELAPMDEPKQEVVSGRIFGRPVTQFQGVMAAVANHVLLACEKLDAQQGAAGRLAVSIQGRPPGGERREASAYTELRPASADPQTLLAAARRCLEEVYIAGREYKRAAVMLSSLEPRGRVQEDLFENNAKERGAVADCLAAINARFGRGKATLGSARLSADWEMQRQYLSPAYLADFAQIPRARCI